MNGLTYVMSQEQYDSYTKGKRKITHQQLITHLNRSRTLRGRVVDVQVQ